MSSLSQQLGTIIRAGTTHSAIVLADGVLEVKRDNLRKLKNHFASAADWAASLGVDVTTLVYSTASTSTKPTKLDRIFSYTAETPHWRIAKDLLDHYRTKLITSRSLDIKSLKAQVTQAEITLLKLDLDPPEFDPMWSMYDGLDQNAKYLSAREYHENTLRYLRKRLAKEGNVPAAKVYFSYMTNPHVFIKKGDQMVPLCYNEAEQKVVVGRTGYNTFEDYTGITTTEFWVQWQRKFTKLSVEIA